MPVGKMLRGRKIAAEKLGRAKELRRAMTPEEKLLWEALRRNQLGVHFRRQQVIEGFIVDFYCHAARLVIELDGDVHQSDPQRESDSRRDKIMRDKGLELIRFDNREISGGLPGVIEKIKGLTRNRGVSSD